MEPPRLAAPVSAYPLVGAPRSAKLNGVITPINPSVTVRQVAADYCAKAGIQYHPPTEYVKVDPVRATKIAEEFDKMKHDPQDPAVKASYDALAHETIAQYQACIDAGLKVDFVDFNKGGDPYAASPRLAIEDIQKNNHFSVFPTSEGFGSSDADVANNPLLAPTSYKISGKTACVNDLFRVVHDYFGHAKEGNGMRADGEENAWRSHVAMFSMAARPAMTSETRGQNSWVNFGPHAEKNRTASGATTHYADQKVGLMPPWTMTDGDGTKTKSIFEQFKEIFAADFKRQPDAIDRAKPRIVYGDKTKSGMAAFAVAAGGGRGNPNHDEKGRFSSADAAITMSAAEFHETKVGHTYEDSLGRPTTVGHADHEMRTTKLIHQQYVVQGLAAGKKVALRALNSHPELRETLTDAVKRGDETLAKKTYASGRKINRAGLIQLKADRDLNAAALAVLDAKFQKSKAKSVGRQPRRFPVVIG